MVFSLVLLGLTLPACDNPSPPGKAEAADGRHSADAGPLIDRHIRILLLDGIQTASVLVREPFNLADPQTGEIIRADVPPGQVAVVFSQSGIDVSGLDVRTDSPAIDLVPTGAKPTQVKLTEEWKDFPGSIRFLRRPEGGAVINLMDIELYLVGVVASEFPAHFHRQAFRAQAIAARTYAWYARQTTGLRRDWDVWATERSQVYGGLERQQQVPQAADAVRDTRGVVCTWSSPAGEKIFCTYYGSRCGGLTAPAPGPGGGPPIPPLAGGVVCEYCRRPDAYRWPQEPRVSKSLIAERLAVRYMRFEDFTTVDRVDIIEAAADGRPLRLAVSDASGRTVEIDSESFRLTIDPTGRLLQSTCFVMTIEPDAIVFREGRGLGHGMGLCQYGADALARAGWHAPAILRHYYPTSRLTRAY